MGLLTELGQNPSSRRPWRQPGQRLDGQGPLSTRVGADRPDGVEYVRASESAHGLAVRSRLATPPGAGAPVPGRARSRGSTLRLRDLAAIHGVGRDEPTQSRNRRQTAPVPVGMTINAVATAFGGPEVISFVDEPVGEPGPGHVLLEVRAASTNPIDYKLFSGDYGKDLSQLPMRLGYEASGVVSAVDEDANGPAGPVYPGDEIIAYPVRGAYAAAVVVPASSVVPKPSTLSFEEASGLMLTGTTAVHALTVTAVGAGDTVVIHGAAGGVGLMAVQLAVHAGARVIGTASEGTHAYLRELGAEPVTYGDGLVERIRSLAPGGVDAAIDTVGTDEATDTSVALVADRNRIVTIAAFQRAVELGLKVIGAGPGGDPGTEIRATARLELVRLAQAGQLHVRVAATYPLREAANALRELSSGHTHGKIVLIP